MELSVLLIILYVVTLVFFLLSSACLWKRFKADKSCFIYDFFMSASSGLTLALVATVMYQTANISTEVNNFSVSGTTKCSDIQFSGRKPNPLIKANVSFECFSLGDGDLRCEWIPGDIQ